MLSIHHIENTYQKLDAVRELFSEYADELGEDLTFQHFDEELNDPLKKYGPPNGSLLIAYWYNEPAGCIALQPLEQGLCEMKRLYVRPQYREHGIGDYLIKKLVHEGYKKGYKKMVLDTLQRLKEAIRLYEMNGFESVSAYYENPLPEVVFMEKELLEVD